MMPARAGRFPCLPGTARGAHRRNVLVLLGYLFVLVLLVGIVIALL
jgi:hypothetical protein